MSLIHKGESPTRGSSQWLADLLRGLVAEGRITINDARAITNMARTSDPAEPFEGVRIYTVTRLGRWWRPTERSALRMVWGEFGHPMKHGTTASYMKARIGYRVTLEQRHWVPR